MLGRSIIAILLFFSMSLLGSDYAHRLQLNINLAKSYSDGLTQSVVPVIGTHNVNVQIVPITDDGYGQPFWESSKKMYIDNGDLSVSIEESALDWVNLLTGHQLFFGCLC